MDKTEENIKKVLVTYEVGLGEFTFICHVIITVENNDVDNSIHNYFLSFCGKKHITESQKGESYVYYDWELAINIDECKVLTEEQFKVLNKLEIV